MKDNKHRNYWNDGAQLHKKEKDNKLQVKRIRAGGTINVEGEKNKYRKCQVKQETGGLKLQNKT